MPFIRVVLISASANYKQECLSPTWGDFPSPTGSHACTFHRQVKSVNLALAVGMWREVTCASREVRRGCAFSTFSFPLHQLEANFKALGNGRAHMVEGIHQRVTEPPSGKTHPPTRNVHTGLLQKQEIHFYCIKPLTCWLLSHYPN